MHRTAHYRSKALSRSQVAGAIAAHDHTEAIRCPLNLALDIHWEWTRYANSNRRAALAKLLESLRHWLGRRVGFYCIAVRENPPSSDAGEHCHALAHVPSDLQAGFLDHVRTFLRGNKRHQKRAMRWAITYNDGKLAYVLKGSTTPARMLLVAMFDTDYERNAFLENTREKTRQGVINGKRLLISQDLGPKAREGAVNANSMEHGRAAIHQIASANDHGGHKCRRTLILTPSAFASRQKSISLRKL
jgi:hypothetical protein